MTKNSDKKEADQRECKAHVDTDVIKRRIYVASSWRNELQPEVVERLKEIGHDVYDFRHPKEGDDGFHWSEIDVDWKRWTPEEYRESLKHPLAISGFNKDYSAMEWADTCILVMPCGRSAHIEAGYFNGAGKELYILLSDGEPELMYKMADKIFTDLNELIGVL